MNKNQLRENLRKHIHDAAYLDAGVERIVDQVVNPKVYSVFMPQIEDVVYKFLGIERPKDRERNGTKNLKDLLPKDLDPVSPESDKNSLKDVSLESVEGNIAEAGENDDLSPMNDVNEVDKDLQDSEKISDELMDNDNATNKQPENLENQLEGDEKNSNKNSSVPNLNISAKSDEKTEEEEEDSPMFEPIDIMNFNESNDSHLSGISELTSHRSRSPDFPNDFSRDNLDFSNHDSQLSKVSSDSRLSIVTDFGLSNHASTPVLPETLKEDYSNKVKTAAAPDLQNNKDNFKEIRDIEPSKANTKEARNSSETIKTKDNVQELKDFNDSKTAKSTPDSTDGGVKNKNDSKDSKDKSKDSDPVKTKCNKDKGDSKESKTHKDRDRDHRKRQSSHSSSKYDKTDKYSKDKSKEKSEKSRDQSEKSKESLDKSKEAERLKEEKKEADKKEGVAKDLKDIYKEKIRELREKKELTEKEKLAKDPKDLKPTKESRDKKDLSRDRKDSRSSSSKSSSRYDDKSSKNEEKSASKNDNKSSSKGVESKESRNDSKDKGKRNDKRQSKDGKESRSKSHSTTRTDSIDKGEKIESKKDNKNDLLSRESDRNERPNAKRDVKLDSQKSEGKRDVRSESQNKDQDRNEKSDARRDSKSDSQSKERKKKDEKKTKTKDDHSSSKKNSNDRRSTDRDGSNGSSSKNSQKSSSSSITNSNKSGSTSLTKESSGTSNSSSETSDNVDVSPSGEIIQPVDSNCKRKDSGSEVKPLTIKMKNENDPDYCLEADLAPKRVDLGQAELSLPLKKRPIQADTAAPNPNDFKVKKPKFAKNFQEAKKLMKIRKRLEKQRLKEYEAAKEKFQMASHSNIAEPPAAAARDDKTPTLPDDERVQIIEVTDDDYEEPYPDFSMKALNISLECQSLTSLENPLVLNPPENTSEKQTKLSEMENSIRQSLQEMISDKKLIESGTPTEDPNNCTATPKSLQSQASVTSAEGVTHVSKYEEKQLKSEDNAEKSDFTEYEESSREAQAPKNEGARKAGAKSNSKSKTMSGKTIDETSPLPSDENCLYFEPDEERAVKFAKFVHSLEIEVLEDRTCPENSSESLEKILEHLGGQIVSALPKTMAPPMPKRKHSTSPLMDIILNNSNNNNNRHKMKELTPEEESSTMKKRKMVRPKKHRAIANVCAIQNLPNGENFVMPLSPESDVSASSEKNSLQLPREDKR